MALSKTKKFLLGLGTFFLALVVLIVAMPLWSPWVLRPVLKNYGVQFGSCQRIGYSRLVLNETAYHRNNVKFSAKRIEVFQPLAWLLNRSSSAKNTTVFAKVDDWRLEVSENKTGSSKRTTVYEALGNVESTLPKVLAWLPSATFTSGEVQIKNEEVFMPSLTWDRGQLKANGSSSRLGQNIVVQADLATHPAKLSFSIHPLGVDAQIDIRRANSAVVIEGTANIQGNQLKLSADFAHDDLFPTKAFINAPSFQIPAERLKLQGYRDLAGSLVASWETNRFTLDVIADAAPKEKQSPAHVAVHATGTTNSIQFDRADISMPWIKANLSRGVVFDFKGKLLSPEAALNVDIDLDRQNFVEATGHFVGDAFLRRSDKKFPVANFRLSSVGFAGYGVRIDRVNLAGKFDWPMLELSPAEIRFADGGVAEAKAKVNVETKEISEGTIKLNGQVGHEFLPPEISYTNIALEAKFSGPFKQPSHSGHLDLAGVALPNLAPLKISADWRGKLFDFERLQTKFTAHRSAIALSGSGKIQTNEINFKLDGLTLSKLGQGILTLKQAANVSVQKTEAKGWKIAMDKIDLRGAERALLLAGRLQIESVSNQAAVVSPHPGPLPRGKGTRLGPASTNQNTSAAAAQPSGSPSPWGEGRGEGEHKKQTQFPRGQLAISATNIDSFLVRDFFAKPPPKVELTNFYFAGAWTNGPVDFTLRARGQLAANETNSFSFQIKAAGDQTGISFEELQALGESGPVAIGRGFVPLRIDLSHATNRFQFRDEQLIDFRADTAPNKEFWDKISELSRLRFDQPEIHIAVTGTMKSPKGKIVANAAGLEWISNKGKKIPSLKNLSADIDLDEKEIHLNRLTMLVEGQPLSAEASLPLGNDFSKHWKKIFDWRKATGRVVAKDVEFAPFVRFAPDILMPQGSLSLDLNFSPGPKLGGSLNVSNAATRPLPGTGPLHDLEAHLLFVEQAIELQDVRGLLGGQPVAISGKVDFAKRSKLGLPLFEVSLIGDNVPLARNPSVIVRGDLNLRASNLTNEIPTILGEVHLRDSFYLGDLKQLLPGRVASAERRPPYFSIPTEPFNSWRLRVRVTGKDFLKVRSPLFRGSITADWRIVGTLGEPMALGDARIESGLIQFPFANFRTTQGFVSLTSEDPYRPSLIITAISRAFGYDLQMNLHGPADEPIIEFSSTPPLTSQQIILMVTAGEVPKRSFEFSSGQKAQKLALFVGKSLLSKFSSDEGGAERLSISTGEEISEKGRETYALEYKLSDDWSIVAEYDRFGALNAGLKWRVYSK